MAICEICNSSFNPTTNSKGRFCSRDCTNIANKITAGKTGQQKRVNNEISYNKSPNKCKGCHNPLLYINRFNTFCSHSCSATITNASRSNPTEETKYKISQSSKLHKLTICYIFYCNQCGKIHQTKRLSKYCCKDYHPKIKREVPYRLPTLCVDGEYSKVFNRTCKYCSVKFVSRNRYQYCNNHIDLLTNRRMQYAFRFNVHHYPHLFDLNFLALRGWYSPRGKSGKWNPTGLSRDHIVSIKDAIFNNYDPYYISHLMNCQLITHKENNEKKTKSSMTYTELINKVDNYDNMVDAVGLAPTQTY